MGNKPCKMCSIAWDIRGETRACMRLKMCTTHGCVSLHMGKPRDYNLVKYMGFPEQENRADISCRHLS